MKRALAAVALIVVLVLPIIFVGAIFALAGADIAPSRKALDEIPSDLLPSYMAAAETCDGLDWTVLAAIHKVETSFGSGEATSSKGAQGPMQFMPATWGAYGLDGDSDGVARINDVEDAIFSAASLLCANGAGDPARLADAIWNYNHSDAYVDEVLALASGYGVIGSSFGVGFASATALVDNPKVTLTSQARSDLLGGVVDQRLVSVLAWIAERHTMTITVFKTGHSKYTRSGSVSNHYYGRGADIFIVDGSPVTASNEAALDVVWEMARLEGELRPGELGHPFGAIGFPGGFTDADHADHIHFGFD